MRILCILLLLLPQVIFGYRYELSICAIFQNEAEWLKEWIEFHRLVGVQHFWLYNNNSSDDYHRVLDPYIKSGVVELIEWPSPLEQDWTPYQNAAYENVLSKSKGVTKWLAAIDIDEFIVPKKVPTVTAILRRFEKMKNVGGLMINWQFFGTANVWDIPPGKTMLEILQMKAPWNYSGNYQVKTICRPETVVKQVVHCCVYKPGYCDVTMNGRGGPNQPIQIEDIAIHHYWTRTEKFLREVKIPRRDRYLGRKQSEEEIQSFIREMNQVSDTSVLRFIPALKKRLNLRNNSI